VVRTTVTGDDQRLHYQHHGIEDHRHDDARGQRVTTRNGCVDAATRKMIAVHSTAPVRCPVCDKRVERRSRQQRYCSRQCMRRANYARKAGSGELRGHATRRVRNPHKSESKNNSLQAAKSRSSIGIIGPRSVIQTEVISGRTWKSLALVGSRATSVD
jgi:hypothetical protein